ncbi:MAG: DNA-binding MarR family transcriptional regulator [Candidatus Azotimanducaceae bacterium]|jgi:DNA-binding MarR family transcriptional regulator
MSSELPNLPLTASSPHLIERNSDQRMRTLLYNFTALADKIAELRKGFSEELQVSPPQYLILMHIAQHQEQTGLTVTQVARDLRVTLSHVTKESTILVDHGQLQRLRNPSDGRSILLATTPQSDAAIQMLSDKLIETNNHLFSGLKTDDFRQLCSGVATVLNNAKSGQ